MKSITIAFDKTIYRTKAIKGAIEAYRDLADFCLADGKTALKVTLKKINPEVADVIGPEFCNYVLALMKE